MRIIGLVVLVPAVLTANEAAAKTTAERLVEEIHRVNTYPLCNNKGECILNMEAKGNTVISTYRLSQHSIEFPKEALTNIAENAEKLRPAFVRDVCGSLQRDFPDKSMRVAGHYYTRDERFFGTVVMTVNECFRK